MRGKIHSLHPQPDGRYTIVWSDGSRRFIQTDFDVVGADCNVATITTEDSSKPEFTLVIGIFQSRAERVRGD